MDRRQMLSALTMGVTSAAVISPLLSVTAAAGDAKNEPKVSAKERVSLASLECIQSGTVCLQHCLRSLATGSTMMADCSKAVTDMLAQARAFHELAVSDSKHLGLAAKAMSALAKDCEVACKKHEGMHAECKRCAECCVKLQEAIASLS